ncbi:hypothetical protein AW59_13200 [Salmonella enterica subsp. enterica serovar Anatum str. USDA-ARS-USMARC-1766]|nr:hypothetical protein AW59_13200 [Salmonella enterica subsp. enterica serovar Anatum str. USDA-ARS-USMARC-1766]KFT78339.1 hypothetical protein SEEB0207_03360 [Salmonella enterica subsp. enterica serovar Bareilly str. CFSAN000207]
MVVQPLQNVWLYDTDRRDFCRSAKNHLRLLVDGMPVLQEQVPPTCKSKKGALQQLLRALF